MNYLKNPITSISNAVEINKLKDKRDELNKDKKEYKKLFNRYEDQIELKKSSEAIISTNNIALSNLRTLFTKSNVKFDVEFVEFNLNIKDEDMIMYKILYDKLLDTNKCIEDVIKHFDKNITIDKEVYTQKITKVDEKIAETNKKLDKVREKQFK